MKKFFVFILSILYLGTATGASFHMHYCMDKLVDWSFTSNTEEECPKCGMEKFEDGENGCCKDEKKFVKQHDVHKASPELLKLPGIDAVELSTPYYLKGFRTFSETFTHPRSHAPPQASLLPAYILFHSILI